VRHQLFSERRQLERNLHDGAQQRLVALALDLKLLQRKLEDDPEAAGRLLERAREELDFAIEELRELARGLHPPILSERGLEPALRAMADRAPVPVRIEARLASRLPEHVETAAYYLIAEALTNAAKHARATAVTVSVKRSGGWARIEISDDGIGGAAARPGGGLRGLAERLDALGATLDVHSPPGAGTTITGDIPLAAGAGLAASA
jgi:signal transduction histidine kinase